MYIYIYPRGLGFSDGEAVGWGGVGHVTVMFMLRWCYVDGRGGVGWGMLPSCSCYVDATLMGGVGWGGACYRHVHVTLMLRWWEGWGGVGHVTVMLMLRWCYVDGRGGVGWGMLPSCSCCVDATLNKNPGLDAVLSALARFRSTVASGLVAPSRAFLDAPWEKWKNVSPLLRACCWLNIQCSQCTI